MAGTVAGSMIFDSKVDTKGFEDGANDISSQVNEMTGSFDNLGKAVVAAFSISVIKNVGAELLGAASDLQEVQNVVDTTFKENAEAINQFAETAQEKFGVSELAAKQYSSTIGAMFKSMGLGQNEILEMSQGITGLAGDMASFYNMPHEQMFDKLRSGISGETEPLKQLGINMSVANLEAFALSEGINKSFNSMTQAEQATLRYQYIMQATADAQGDVAKTGGTYANQTRNLKDNITTLSAALGELLLPAATEVIRVINTIITAMTSLIKSAQDGNIISIVLLGIISALGILIGLIALFSVKMLVANTLTSLWTSISTAATAATSALGAAFAFLTSPIGLVILAVGALIALIVLLVKHWDTVKKAAISSWESIKDALIDANKWFDETFVEPVRDGINSMLGFIEGLVNGFIGGINKMIDALNELSFTVPDWVPGIGGNEFGFDISPIKEVSIPRLATGAVIPPNGEFVATLGDQKYGNNLEAPEGLIRQIMRDELSRNGGNSGGNTTVVMQIDGKQFATAMAPYNAGEERRRGTRLINGVT